MRASRQNGTCCPTHCFSLPHPSLSLSLSLSFPFSLLDYLCLSSSLSLSLTHSLFLPLCQCLPISRSSDISYFLSLPRLDYLSPPLFHSTFLTHFLSFFLSLSPCLLSSFISCCCSDGESKLRSAPVQESASSERKGDLLCEFQKKPRAPPIFLLSPEARR